MNRSFLFILPLLFILAMPAQARIYMYVDADGKKGATDRRESIPAGAKITATIDMGGESDSYSTPRKSGSKPSSRTPSPASFPRIDSNTQKRRDDLRQSILEEELSNERKSLEEATRRLSLAAKPLAGETPASPAYVSRLRQLRGAVENHQRNITAIQKELGMSR